VLYVPISARQVGGETMLQSVEADEVLVVLKFMFVGWLEKLVISNT
jgi:hypothetical protein